MSDFATTFLIIISEVSVFFAVVIIITVVYRFRKRIKLKLNAKQFVKKIKSESSEHGEKLKDILLHDYNLDDETATKSVEKFIKQENILFSKIIDLYLGSKNCNLDELDDDVKNLIKTMHSVTIDSVNQAEKKSELGTEYLTEQFESLKKEIEQVKAEKSQAQKELKDAMDTMEGMMTEYASMYSGGVDHDNLEPEKDIEKVKTKIDSIKKKTGLDEEEKTKNDNKSQNVDLNVDVPDLDLDDS